MCRTPLFEGCWVSQFGVALEIAEGKPVPPHFPAHRCCGGVSVCSACAVVRSWEKSLLRALPQNSPSTQRTAPTGKSPDLRDASASDKAMDIQCKSG